MAKTAITEHVIPPITDPMGKYWNQPDRRRILVDDTHAIMSQRDFDALHEYSCSTPTGVYPGKMWKRNNNAYTTPRQQPEWWLVWFGFSDKGPQWCSNNFRRILIA
jgi:hypothetical protein